MPDTNTSANNVAAYDKAAEGKVELATVDIEAYVMAAEALDEAAAAVAKRIRAYKDFKPNEYGKTYPLKTLIVFNEQDATAVRQYRAFRIFTQTISDAYRKLLAISHPAPQLESPLAAITPALLMQGIGVALQSAANVLSFFRTDVKFTGVNVAPAESALVAVFIRRLHEKTSQDGAITVYYPAVFPLETSVQAAGLMEQLSVLQGQRNRAEENLHGLEKQPDPKSAEVGVLISEIKSANAAFDKFIAGLLSPGESGDMKSLLLLLRAAALQDKLEGGAHWLHLQVQKSGGNLMTQTGGVLHRPRFTCSGGAIVTYMVADADMTIVLSGVETGYIAQREVGDAEE